MRAASFVGERQIEIVEVPEPSVGPGEVKVRVTWSAICGSDKGLFLSPGEKPGIHGHEASGIIVEVGEGVTQRHVGQKVVVYAVIGCGHCAFCQRREYTRCQAKAGAAMGGFGEFLTAPERNALPLPDDIGTERGCVLSDCIGTPYKAARLVGVSPGEWVAIFGGGPIGLNAVQVCAALGAKPIHIEPLQYRREAGQRLGAVESLDPTSVDLDEAVRGITGAGAARAMECSGVIEAERAALSVVAPGGSVVYVGENGSGLSVNISEDLIRRDVTVMGSWYFFPQHMEEVVELYRAGKLDPLSVVSHRVPLDRIAEGFEFFCDRTMNCTKAIVSVSEDAATACALSRTSRN